MSAASAAVGLKNKQLMQRKPLCEPPLHVSGVQAVFVISAWMGGRTVFACMCLCVCKGVSVCLV